VRLSYRKLFNLGNFQHEAFELTSDEFPPEKLDEVFRDLKEKVEHLHLESHKYDEEQRLEIELQFLEAKKRMLQELKKEVMELEEWAKKKIDEKYSRVKGLIETIKQELSGGGT